MAAGFDVMGREKGLLSGLGKMLFLIQLLTLSGCAFPAWYSAEPIEAWVVDEEGKPLEGVIAVAHWHVWEGTLAGTNSGGEIQIMETVTDKSGHFYFPAWGPKMLPPQKNKGLVDQYLGNEAPNLLFFKSGYQFLSLANSTRTVRNTSSLRQSIWNGKRLTMKSFDGTLKEYAEHVLSAHWIGFAYDGRDCEWTKIPRMLVALHKEKLALEQQANISYTYLLVDPIDHVFERERCLSKKDFFADYIK